MHKVHYASAQSESFVARTIECFYPGDSFPAISITGKACSLNCKHCGRKYLEGMIPATTPDELCAVAEALAHRGAKGFLLSGGADLSGKVRLVDYVDAIKEIKSTTELRINAHVGLISSEDVKRLVGSGIDGFSVDIYGSDETIREVLGINADAQDYLRDYDDFVRWGAPIVAPHICIGIHGGQLVGELAAIEMLGPRAPRTLVLISLIPTKGTQYENVAVPSAGDIMSVVRKAREVLPDTRLLLGCMRSKLDRSNEHSLVAAGLDGIVLPANGTVEKLLAEGYRIRKRSVCCAMQ